MLEKLKLFQVHSSEDNKTAYLCVCQRIAVRLIYFFMFLYMKQTKSFRDFYKIVKKCNKRTTVLWKQENFTTYIVVRTVPVK